MLSYRHAYHAGNHADLLKHAVWCYVIDYLRQKEKPFALYDSHAGGGEYPLAAAATAQQQEYRNGIARLLTSPNPPPALHPYLKQVREYNPPDTFTIYPGSPALARQQLRPGDQLFLCERHPAELAALEQRYGADRQVIIDNADGFQQLSARLPPTQRRGAILIDPSYEIKQEYETAPAALQRAWRRFRTGCYLLWYPVVERRRARYLIQQMINSAIPRQLWLELAIQGDQRGHGMSASGLIVINPPWPLAAAFSEALPWLQQQLGRSDGHWRCEWLVTESP